MHIIAWNLIKVPCDSSKYFCLRKTKILKLCKARFESRGIEVVQKTAERLADIIS
jgi:predicted secreted protein